MPTVDASPAAAATQVPSTRPLEVSTRLTEAEWDAYVDARPDATGYHLYRWRHVFERAFGHRTEYLGARRDDRVVGVLPLVLFRSGLFGRFAVSLPFLNYGGVVADDEAAALALLGRAHALCVVERLAHVELRHTARRFDSLPCRQHKVSMRLSLAASTDEAWSALDRKVRNQVRKAEKSGLTVRSGGAELVPAFYGIFAENMRDLGTPVYPRRLFDEVLALFPDEARVFLVEHNGSPVAASITYRYRDVVEVPWASSLNAYRAMCPNNLLYWGVITWAINEGLRVLDFGRSSPDAGTYHFKLQWGAQPEPLSWEYQMHRGGVPDRGPQNPRFQVAIRVWQHLPLAVTNAIGPVIVRGIP